MKKKLIMVMSLMVVLVTTSCSLDPTIADNTPVTLTDTDNMRQLIDGSYYTISSSSYLGRNMVIAGEIRADNTFANGSSGRFIRWGRMNIQEVDGDVSSLMAVAYGSLANANIIINSDIAGIEGDEDDKNQMLGEAYAMRAFVHFDLLRLYGQKYLSGGSNLGISYIKQYKGPKDVPRGSVESNFEDLKGDIAEAIHYFELGQNSEYATSQTNFTLDAAYALQSRVGTYMKDYAYAYEGSSQIVDSYDVTSEADFVAMWEQQTPPAGSIFEIFQNTTNNNAGNSSLAYIYRGDAYGDVVAFDNLLEDAEFEEGDVRASEDMIDVVYEDEEEEIGYLRNIGKYPSMGQNLGRDNLKVFRIEEVVLNHAEALANGAGSGDALQYLNMIPQNRGASNYANASMENIIKERRKEFVFEGFRLYDLARMGMDIRDMEEPINNHGLIEAGSFKFAFPIPEREINANNQATQNPGY